MMFVCRPEFSFNYVLGLEVLYPNMEILIPMALRQVMLPNTGTDRFRHEVEVARDAVLLILSQPSLNLLFHLVDGTERAVEFRELVVVALKIGTTVIIPGVVVRHLYVRKIDVMMGKAGTVKEAGTGVSHLESISRKCKIDGKPIGFRKARRQAFIVE